MNEIINEDAKVFAKHYPDKIAGMTVARTELDKKLINYPANQYRFIFLKFLKFELEIGKQKHIQECKNPTCKKDRDYQIALLTVTQDLEISIEENQSRRDKEDAFSIQEKLDIMTKLETFKEGIDEIKTGQEIIFNEIDSMKEYFDLGKKSWTQLLKGKLFDLVTENVLEKAIAPGIYEILTESIKAGHFKLPN